MELEKEITGKFENDYHKSVVNVLYTYGWVSNLLRQNFDKYQVTLQQFNVLRILRGQYPKPATINLLKERMLDKMSDASRIVMRLVQKELVSRCISQHDRRAVDILITDKGLDILAQIDADMQVNDILKKNLNEEEAKELNRLLDKMRG
ncbi:MAG TPA: MarR family transcriptional regulator [Daejeonella sp.]|nr:MarR family transcriptional regulator [Daejeonella sp.]